MEGFDGYELSLEREKSYVLTKLQGRLTVQLNTRSCSLNVGVCFRSVVITMNGKLFDISIDPTSSGVSLITALWWIVHMFFLVEDIRGRAL